VVVRELLHKLRSHVKWGTLDRGQHDGISRHGTSETEITKLNNTVSRDQDVLRFHISMDDPV
jgi:hypothetical protein